MDNCPAGVSDTDPYFTDESEAQEEKSLRDVLDDQEFYDLMQTYRHAPMSSQDAVVEAYEAVKCFIREKVVNQMSEELKVAKEFIAEHIGVEPD